jgi:hypothetical protein
MARALAALILLGMTFGCSCHATTREASALQEVLRAKGPADSTNDPKWRTSLAAALHRYCESVLVQVPRNTPQEDRWADDEFTELGILTSKPIDLSPGWQDRDLRQAQRWDRVLNSVEFAV